MKNFIIKFINVHFKECYDLIGDVVTEIQATGKLKERHGSSITVLEALEL